MIEPVARIYIELQDIQPRYGAASTSHSPRTCSPCTTSSRSPWLDRFASVPVHYRQSRLRRTERGGRILGAQILSGAGLRLRTLVARGVERFLYVYDFGDDWRHDIVIRTHRRREPHIDYPVFVDGKRRGPPETWAVSAGSWSFSKLSAIRCTRNIAT